MGVGGTGVGVGGNGVSVAVGGTGVEVAVGGTGVDVGADWGVAHAARTSITNASPMTCAVNPLRFIAPPQWDLLIKNRLPDHFAAVCITSFPAKHKADHLPDCSGKG